jgi:hypothetical protein
VRATKKVTNNAAKTTRAKSQPDFAGDPDEASFTARPRTNINISNGIVLVASGRGTESTAATSPTQSRLKQFHQVPGRNLSEEFASRRVRSRCRCGTARLADFDLRRLPLHRGRRRTDP